MISFKPVEEANHTEHAALRLLDVAANLVAVLEQLTKVIGSKAPSQAEERSVAAAVIGHIPDPMTQQEVEHELRLADRQLVALRRLWGFPQPQTSSKGLIYSRQEVERWARRQPNQSNLAAVLRLRRRRQLPADLH
jgi:hypothetical protein